MIDNKPNIRTGQLFLLPPALLFCLFHAPLSAAEAEKTEQKVQGPPQSGPAGKPVAESKPLDVTIMGEAKDEVPLIKDPPPMTLSFEEVVGLSREGQTARVLSGSIAHLTHEQKSGLVQLDSRQTVIPLAVRIPRAPFFQMEPPPGTASTRWELRVVDQNNRMVGRLEGTSLPPELVSWDGFSEGEFKVKAGPAYTPLLEVTDAQGKKQITFGEPAQWDALQYEQ